MNLTNQEDQIEAIPAFTPKATPKEQWMLKSSIRKNKTIIETKKNSNISRKNNIINKNGNKNNSGNIFNSIDS